MTPKPWVIYTRVSDDDQADGASPEAQLESCRAYAKARGWEVSEELYDDGYTGRNDRRPGYQRVLELLRSGTVAGVIAWKLKRLSRRVRDTYQLMDLLNSTGCNFATVVEHWDTTTPMGRAMVGVGAIFNQLESEENGVQTRAAMTYLRRHGFWTGGPAVPAGTKVIADGDRKRLVRADDAATVEQAWPWVVAGASLREVAERLTASGVRGPKAGWTPSAVRSLLLSTQVTGILVDGATQAVVRAKLAARTTPMRRGTDASPGSRAVQPSPLAGLLRCPACEGSMFQVTARGHGGTYRYFRCARKDKRLCQQKDVRCEPVEAQAIEAIAEALRPGSAYERQVHAELGASQALLEQAKADRGRLTAERDQLTARISQLTLRTQIGTAAWTEAMRLVGAELERVDRGLAQLAGTIAAGEVDAGSLDIAIGEMRAAAGALAAASREEMARLLRLLVVAVRLDGDDTVLDLYHPKQRTPTVAGEGSCIGQDWRANRHGPRTIQVRIMARRSQAAGRTARPGHGRTPGRSRAAGRRGAPSPGSGAGTAAGSPGTPLD